MVFSSPIFVFLFLPLTLALYFLVPRGARNIALLLASAVFYLFGELQHWALIATSLVVNYFGGRIIGVAQGRGRLAALWVFVGANLAGLLWFKYAGFLAGNANTLAHWLGLRDVVGVPEVLLPLGISFFTFHAISYLVDVYRRKVEPQRDPFAYALYILLFPQLIAGPIIRYHDIAEQLHSRSTRWADFAEGCRRFVIGLGKKLLIANPMGAVADGVFSTAPIELSTAAVWIGAIAYTLQIYFDFSAYSDMAIGLCRMFGFRIRENFNHPYVAESIQDFWRRWHMSLSNWFRDYVYIPLGGNRHGSWRTALNLLTVFLLCGLWHGASWTFVVWGLFHGAFLAFERTAPGAAIQRLPALFRHAYALLVVIVGWVLFRADTLPQALQLIHRQFVWHEGRSAGSFLDEFGMLVMLLGIVASLPMAGRVVFSFPEQTGALRQYAVSISLVVLSLACFVALFATTYNPFIYFRF